MKKNVSTLKGRFTPRSPKMGVPGTAVPGNETDPAHITPAYKIGAIARLTGLSTHTLRKWEDRYAVVAPLRSEGGDRVYTRNDLRRLALIKDLIDAGQSIGKVAKLSTGDLERACDNLHGPLAGRAASPVTEGRIRVAAAGDALPGLLAHQTPRFERLDFVAIGRNLDQLAATLAQLKPVDGVDVLLLECPSLQAAHRRIVHEAMKQVGARAAVVLYSFGARRVVSSVRGRNVALLRAPVESEELQRTMLGLMVDVSAPRTSIARDLLIGDANPPPARFDSATVAELASRPTSIECECPQHLGELWLALTAFEEYCKDCETTAPDDAALHHYLRCTTGQARALMEAALERAAHADGLMP